MLDLSNSTTSTATSTTTSPASYSEIELCALWGMGAKAIYNRRMLGNMPPHFLKGKQIRYLVPDVEDYTYTYVCRGIKKSQI